MFSAGLMTVLSVSSELDMGADAPQGRWLRAALAAVDRRATPFVMVYMHRSLYVKPTAKAGAWPNYDPKFAGDWSAMQYFNAVLEPLLNEYGVDLVYTGHTHVTQRACATVNFTCAMRPSRGADGFAEYLMPANPVYYVVGNLGANTDSTNTNVAPPWLDFESASFAYARVVVRNATVLEVSLVDALSGAVIDRSRIVKAPAPAPAPIAPAAKAGDSSAAIGGGVAAALALVAIGVWAAGNARVRGLLLRKGGGSYAPFGGRRATATAAAAAPPPVVVVAKRNPASPALAGVLVDGAGGSAAAADARRARVESARGGLTAAA